MHKLTERMAKHGIEPDKNGQYDFCDIVFFDAEVSDINKLYWLTAANRSDQDDRIRILLARTATKKD